MKRLSQLLAAASVAAALCLSAQQAMAQQRQGRGNMDPEQMRQRMMERYKEILELSSDAEWKVIEPRITKVMEARRDIGFGGGGRGFMGRRPGGDAAGDNNAQNDRRPRMGGEPNPDAEALQKAIESKASSEEIKAKLAKFRQSRQQKRATLEKAQEELKKVLSLRQEAALALRGDLD